MFITNIRVSQRQVRARSIPKLLSKPLDPKTSYFSINSTSLWTKQERNELWATCGVSPFDTPSHIYIRELGECRASCSYGFTGNRHGGPMGRRPIEAVIRWRLGPVSRTTQHQPPQLWLGGCPVALVPNTGESASVLRQLTYRWAF